MMIEGGELRKLLKLGIGQVNAALTGRHQAQARLRSLVASVRDAMLQRCAESEAVAAEYGAEVEELQLLCTWPDDEDEVELALRFHGVGNTLLRAVTRPDDPAALGV
jgi:hypothetical protein